MQVVLMDAGGSNIGSLRYALQRLDVEAIWTTDVETIRSADRVILPGVGTARCGMSRLHELGLVELLRSLRQPVLGICLGMQLLFAHSEEDDTPCLGLIPAAVKRFTERPGLRVPHMGWNRLQIQRRHPLLTGLNEGEQVYFVHSYAAPVGSWTLASAFHGGPFSAVVACGNFYGMQCHPERSASVGVKLLWNFLGL